MLLSTPLKADTDTALSVNFGLYPLLCQDIGPLRVHGQILRFRLLQFEPKDAHIFTNITIILQHTNSYMFRARMAHHQGAHNCIKQLLNP